MLKTSVLMAAVAFLTLSVTEAQAGFIFRSTADASSWEVAVSQPGIGANLDSVDIDFSQFPTTGFVTATSYLDGPRAGVWIANNSNGYNNGTQATLFVFRQTFDLTGFDPTTAKLEFQWAADDSGQRFAFRGTWTPKYRLNDGPLMDSAGVWPGGESYDFGNTTSISSGFVNGSNTLSFYVEGNGFTDGFALRTISATANEPGGTPLQAPAPPGLALAGSGVLAALALRAIRRRAPVGSA